MSVTFWVAADELGQPVHRCSCDYEGSCAACLASLNLNERNAADLLVWLALPSDQNIGAIPARELAARCQRRLWPEERNTDPALETIESARTTSSARVVMFGRTAGYLRERTEQLHAIAVQAGDLFVSWG